MVQQLMDIPSVEGRNAELALFRRRPQEAESILLQANLAYRAIKMHIRLFNWERCGLAGSGGGVRSRLRTCSALDIAIQHKTHIDTVLAYRQKYYAAAQLQDDKCV